MYPTNTMNPSSVVLMICKVAFVVADFVNNSTNDEATTVLTNEINWTTLPSTDAGSDSTSVSNSSTISSMQNQWNLMLKQLRLRVTTRVPVITSTKTTPKKVFSFSTFSRLGKDWHLTKILTKKWINLTNHNDKSIQIATPCDGDFQSFIQDSAIWVDKSLLIRRIMKGLWNSDIVVIAPPKWGKTITLSMLKFYCELPLNADGFETPKEQSASYLYFNEGKVVMKDGTIQELDGLPFISDFQEHLADHPVIYMSGKNLTMKNGLESLRMMIHQIYKCHDSFLRRLDIEHRKAGSQEKDGIAENMDKFRAYYDLDKVLMLNESEVVHGIQNLIELLFKVYKRKVVLLFDDYEYYVYRSYFSDEPANVSNCSDNFTTIWEQFLRRTFASSQHLEKAITTGAIRANDPSLLQGFPTYYRAYVFDNVDLYPFYGIFEREFLEIARLRGIDNRTIENATQWYGGYRTLSHMTQQMYSPHSVSRFISELQIRNFQSSSLLTDFVDELIRKPGLIQEYIHSTMKAFNRGKTDLVGVFNKFFMGLNLQHYEELQKISVDEIEYGQGLHIDAVGSILTSSGYAAVLERNPNQLGVFVKMVPNREIYTHISGLLSKQ